MKQLPRVFLLFVAFLSAIGSDALAQDKPSSSWGVAAGLVPKWESSGSIKKFATLIFTEDHGPIDLRGSEFRIGVARGRWLAGGWEVSLVQKKFAANETRREIDGSSCNGSGTQTLFVMNCERFINELTPNDLRLVGVEANKFISFVTIARRVQIGMNVGGGIATGKGTYNGAAFYETYSCRFTNGQQPNYDLEDTDKCLGGALTQGPVVQTGTLTEPFTHMLAYTSNRVPLGRVEIAVAALVAPRVKVRISGGFNYPGSNGFAVTGLYFFGDN